MHTAQPPGLTRLHVVTRWTKSPPPQVSEGGDCTRKPRLLRPRTEFQHRVEAMVFLAVDHTLPSMEKKKERERKKNLGKKPTAPSIPRWSPIQVLTRPDPA